MLSDGSKATEGNIGVGFLIFQLGRQTHSSSQSLGKNLEVHDAEVLAALHGIRDAITLSTTRFSNNLWIFLDNKQVAQKLLSKLPARS